MKPSRILLPFSFLYGMIVALRNAFFENKIFRTYRLSIPVISVGNMTTGGTGKTPIVEMLASLLVARGVRAAIVSRGYKRQSRGMVVVSDGARVCAEATRSGDEPQQLAQALPGVIVIVDEDRVLGARHAQEALHAQAVILDDGFQHRRLGRSVDIVLVDGQEDLFGMPMLPAGHRREPFAALARADAFVITKCTDATNIQGITRSLRGYNPQAPVLTSSYAPEAVVDLRSGEQKDAASLAGVSAVAFCGIGQPESFRRTCASLGVTVAAFHAFADHHPFAPEDLVMLEESRTASHASLFLTTEKDARRIAGGFAPDAPLLYLKMRARINEADRLEAVIARALASS